MESPPNGAARKVSDSKAPVVSQESLPDRGGWGGQAEFVLTCVGFAVGLGNVWRFPYLCYANGGGAFLIPYFIVLIFIGIPMYFMELSFGQFSSKGPISIWVVNPMFKGLGIAMQIVAAYIVLYYNVIVAWCLFYFFASMTKTLPWTFCGNWWNTEACIDRTMNLSAVVDENGTINGLKPTTPSEEYYYNNVLRLSPGLEYAGGLVWQLSALLLLAWIIIFLVLLKGVASVGKASYFVSLFPYVLLTVLLGQAAVLDGALDGVKFYMTPDWERLKEPQVWADATTQIFYSLGICMGSLIAMSSYNKFNNNCRRDAILIPIINCLTSVYAGFVVFTMLGYISKEKNIPIKDIAREGPGLVFVVYPEGLATLPVAPLWSSLFFFMMTTLGFSSQFSMAEGVCAAITDEYPVLLKRTNALLLRGGYCLVNFLLGLPMVTKAGFYIFNIMNDYCAGYTLLFTAIFEIMAISWIYDYRRFADDIEIMLGKRPNNFWIGCWVGIAPILIIAVTVFKAIGQTTLTFEDYVYPDWGNALAWLVVAFPLVIIVGWMIGVMFSSGAGRVCVKINEPESKWGPVDPENRKGIYADLAYGVELASMSSESSGSTDSNDVDDVLPYANKQGMPTVSYKSEPPPYNGIAKLTTPGDLPGGRQVTFDNKGFDEGNEVVVRIGTFPMIPDETEAL